MATKKEKRQALITEIEEVVSPYLEAVQYVISTTNKDVDLTLTHQQLLLLSALYGQKNTSVAILLSPQSPRAEQVVEQLNLLSDWINAKSEWHLLEGELSSQEVAGDVVSRLSQTIHHFLRQTPQHHFVLPAGVLALNFPSREEYQNSLLVLHRHERRAMSWCSKELILRGYTRYAAAQEPGSFSVRGENIDLCPPASSGAGYERLTITFHGTTIEHIVQHTNATEHSASRRRVITSAVIPPVIFPAATTVASALLDNFSLLKAGVWRDDGAAGVVFDALHTLHPFPLTTTPLPSSTAPTHILYANHDRVVSYVTQHDIKPVEWCQTEVASIPLALYHERFNLLTEGALFTDPPATRPTSLARGRALVAELSPNKPAVHSDHGIGIFEGLQTRTINGSPKEYLVLRYAAGDTLSVPVEYAHKVTPYLGEKFPTINRLGGTLWQKTRRRAEHDAEAFARELLELAGQRKASEAHRYTLYPDIKASLETSFPYELTPDQQAALAAIEEDLQEPHPLDRLVVGDVGFGKTEIALRTARHVIANNKQVALLAPTTLLVQQHSDTARQRFPELANQIGVLSRFSSPREQADVRHYIKNGDLKLIIGTHALLSAGTMWHNLGLVIIDEEQRFGVKHKEHFKKIRATTDFLSLSATPIPRTLSMALSGLKQLSLINTPPIGRKEVITQVARNNDAILQAAITQELKRHGQVYIVAPKVRSLGTLAREVQHLTPTARVAVAHGQLPPAQLAHIMHQFDSRQIDILISSSIIENGLDLPNANTIIVMQATHFGLSDLYQLRGRVGRREKQGYAYFFYNQTELTPIQRQRLTALTEASRLGSGWSLAQRDLEIRGAGNFLGAEQSGTVNQVGVQLYLDMVYDAVQQKNEPILRRHDVEIKLPLPALIPQHYIAADDTRSHFYQQLGRATTTKDITSILRTMADTYGALPPEVTNFELLLTLQHCAAANSISHVESQPITPPDEDPYWRLTVTTKKVTATLQKLQALGNWSVRNNTLTHDLIDISPDFVRRLIVTLS